LYDPKYEEVDEDVGITPRELCYLKQAEVIVQNGSHVEIYKMEDLTEPVMTKEMKKDQQVYAFSILHLAHRNLVSRFTT